jgi:hypothetical protein
LLASKKTFEPYDFCFGGHKWRDKWHCEVEGIQP